SDGSGIGNASSGRQCAVRHVLIGAAGIGEHRLHLAAGFRVRIVERYIDAIENKAGGPARADDTAANAGRARNLAIHRGALLVRPSFLRTSSGPRTRAPRFSMMVTARSTSWALVASTPFSSQRLSSS